MRVMKLVWLELTFLHRICILASPCTRPPPCSPAIGQPPMPMWLV